jgi:hypothetical protein
MTTNIGATRGNLPTDITAMQHALRRQIYPYFRAADVVMTEDDLPLPDGKTERTTAMRRRRGIRRDGEADTVQPGYLELIEEDGVLHWELDSDPWDLASDESALARAPRRRGSRRDFDVARTVIEQFKFAPADGSAVSGALIALDRKLNPNCVDANGVAKGVLHEVLDGGTIGDPKRPVEEGSILLAVHGTFSNAASNVGSWAATAAGREFLGRARKKYDQILAFEHATLSASPVLNALELTRAFAGSSANVDVVCHSRGGLVVRWWMEVFDPRQLRSGRVVFVGAPLAGSSLAAPNRIRAGLDLVTNAGFALGKGAQIAAVAVPWIGAVGALIRILASATGALSKTPVVDVALAMIPGLAAQAKTNNNVELQGLQRGLSAVPGGYHFILSDFEPAYTEEGLWKFWKQFTRIGDTAKDWAADKVFDAANDLVVDTASMTQLSEVVSAIAPGRLQDFGHSALVHHLNYFDQPDTYEFIQRAFGPGSSTNGHGFRRVATAI